jgi:hypothetical protein
VKFVVRDKYPEIMFPIPTDIPEENGMQIFRLLKLKKTEQFLERTYAQDAFVATKSTALSNYIRYKSLQQAAGFFSAIFMFNN